MSEPHLRGTEALPTIDTSPHDARLMEILATVARDLPKVLRDMRVVAKGSTALALGYGPPRPSTDYDCDLDRRISKPQAGEIAAGILQSIPGVSGAH